MILAEWIAGHRCRRFAKVTILLLPSERPKRLQRAPLRSCMAFPEIPN